MRVSGYVFQKRKPRHMGGVYAARLSRSRLRLVVTTLRTAGV
jgi:hypothetical protein